MKRGRMAKQYAIEFKNITKKFGKIIANDDISLKVEKGKVHALIGENGAGKSTLMSILFGIYQPNSGTIEINGKNTEIKDPKHATGLGIGMVHQHFKLVEAYDAVDNIILGKEPRKFGIFTDKSKARKKILELSKKYKMEIDVKMKIRDMSVGMQQRVEILKMLYSDAEILIFDEPTAVLTPSQIKGFLTLVKNFREKGKTILIITHKLEEIKEVADTATIIRRGKSIGDINVKTTTTNKMASMMVGRDIVETKNKYVNAKKNPKILEVKNITFVNHKTKKKTLNDISFDVHAGEIVAIAGVEGNGQSELSAVISGLSKIKTGEILLDKYNITKTSIKRRYEVGLSHVPEDRHKHGLILDMSITDNMTSQLFYKYPFSKFGILKKGPSKDFSLEVIQDFDVRGSNSGTSTARSLSGGNQQKAIVGREMKKDHKLIVMVQPTRGLDLGAIENIHNAILTEKKLGKSTLLISYELNEVLALADRIIVFNDGKITGELTAKEATKEKIGRLMGAN